MRVKRRVKVHLNDFLIEVHGEEVPQLGLMGTKFKRIRFRGENEGLETM